MDGCLLCSYYDFKTRRVYKYCDACFARRQEEKGEAFRKEERRKAALLNSFFPSDPEELKISQQLNQN